ncbi:MerR family transcriptional regulator [Saccharopolyspora sp. NPDC050389]|uniref:MerR family transcriptional regulator n=1 Tax=Saccharopolyspora sp. NPDC050389 TaxID=3155516 RepID=UPI0033EF6469
MTDPTPNLTIGQVTDRTGLSVDTLRFYEREELFAHPVGRDRQGRRVYSEYDVEWLGICTMLRATGMPLAEIRRYTALVRQGNGNERDRLAILREHEERVTGQLAQINRCLDLISYKVRVYQERLGQGTADELWTAQRH